MTGIPYNGEIDIHLGSVTFNYDLNGVQNQRIMKHYSHNIGYFSSINLP